MVRFSSALIPPQLVGIKVFRDEPFRFDFILDKGDFEKQGAGGRGQGNDVAVNGNDPILQAPGSTLQAESARLIRYFLASLTIPEKDLWVNLSPEEKDRIIPSAFGLTEMGQDLLAQDYLLKQVSSSALHPDEALGKRFWDEVYREAAERYGTTDIPLDSRNRVWIVPADVTVYEKADTQGASSVAVVGQARLKVMLETDYLAQPRVESREARDIDGIGSSDAASSSLSSRLSSSDSQEIAKSVLREIVIPALEKEVNEGAQFSRLRQVYHSFILAAWYKRKLKDSITSSIYVDKNKTSGVDTGDADAPQKIYEQYVASFRKGVFNFVKDEKDGASGEVLPRKYFSGGIVLSDSAMRVLQIEEMMRGGDFIPDRCVIVSSAAQPAGQTGPVSSDTQKATFKEALDIEANIRHISPVRPQVVRFFTVNFQGREIPFEARYRKAVVDKGRMNLADVFAITISAKGKVLSEGEVIEADPEILFLEYERPREKEPVADLYLKRAYFKRLGLQGGLFKTFMSLLVTDSIGMVAYSKVEEPETLNLLDQTGPESHWAELAHSQIRQTLMGRTYGPRFMTAYMQQSGSIVGYNIGILDKMGSDLAGRLEALLSQAADVERAYGLSARRDRSLREELRRRYPFSEIERLSSRFEMFRRFVEKAALFHNQHGRVDQGLYYDGIARLLVLQITRLHDLAAIAASQAENRFVITEESINQVNVSTSSAKQILDAVDAKAGEKILDLGSGRGDFVLQAARAGLRATGIELNADQLRQAQDLVDDAVAQKILPKGRVTFLQGDFLSPEFSFKDYDILYMFTMLDEKSSEKFADKVLRAWQEGASFRLVLYYAPRSEGLIRQLSSNRNVRTRESSNSLIYVFQSNLPAAKTDLAQAGPVVTNALGESALELMARVDAKDPPDLFRTLHRVEKDQAFSYPDLLAKIDSRDMDFWKILQEPAYRAMWDDIASWDNGRFESEWNKVFSAWTLYNVPSRVPDIVAELTNGFPEDGNVRKAWDHYVGNISSLFVNPELYRSLRLEQEGDRGAEAFTQDMKAGILFLELLRRWYRAGSADHAQSVSLTSADYHRERPAARRAAARLRAEALERLQRISSQITLDALSRKEAEQAIFGFEAYIRALEERETSPGLGARFSRGHFRAVRIALQNGSVAFSSVISLSNGDVRMVRLPMFTRYAAPRTLSLMYVSPQGGRPDGEGRLVAYGIEEEVDGFPPEMGFDLLPEFRQGARDFSVRELYEAYRAAVKKDTGAEEWRLPNVQIFTSAVGGDAARTLRFYLGTVLDIYGPWRKKNLVIPAPSVWGEGTVLMGDYLDWLLFKNAEGAFDGEAGLKALERLMSPLKQVPFFSLSAVPQKDGDADSAMGAISVVEKDRNLAEITMGSGQRLLMSTVDDPRRMSELSLQWLEINKDFGALNREYWTGKLREPGAFVVDLRSADGSLVGLSLAHRWKGLPSEEGMMEDRYVLALTEIIPSERGKHLGEILSFRRLEEVVRRSRAAGLTGDIAAQPVSKESAGILRKAGFMNRSSWTIYRGEELPEDGVVKAGDEDLLEEWWGVSLEAAEAALKTVYLDTYRTPRRDVSVQPDLPGLEHLLSAKETSGPKTGQVRSRYHEVNNFLMVFSGNLELLAESTSLSAEVLQEVKAIEKTFLTYYFKHMGFHARRAEATVQEFDDHFRFLLEGIRTCSRAIDALEQRTGLKGEDLLREGLKESSARLLEYLGSLHGDSLVFEQVSPQDVALAPWLDRTAGMISLNEGVHLVQEVGADLHIWADPSKLANVFVNIIKNSQEAMGPKGGTITITAHQDGKFVTVRLQDTGPGIAPEDLPRIFDRGFTKGKAEGSGIGLDIVKTIVKAHGGTITAESRPGEGAAFILRLPADSSMISGRDSREEVTRRAAEEGNPGEYLLPNQYAVSANIERAGQRLQKLFAGRPVRELNVLDLATGTGAVALSLARAGVGSITGIDVSEDMLAAAKKKWENSELSTVSGGVKMSFLQGDVFDAVGVLRQAGKGDRFDAITIGYTLHPYSMEDRKELFRSLVPLLSPDGKILIIGRVIDEFQMGAEAAKAPEKYAGILKDLGFRDVSWEGTDNFVVWASTPDPSMGRLSAAGDQEIEAKIVSATGKGLWRFVITPEDIQDLRDSDGEAMLTGGMAFKMEDFGKAFRRGAPIAFDFSAMAQDRDPIDVFIMFLQEMKLKVGIHDWDKTGPAYVLQELFKNALIHGNHFDLRLPVYIYADWNDRQEIIRIHVIDTASDGQMEESVRKDLLRSGLMGDGKGIELASAGRQYERQDIRGIDGGRIGRESVVRWPGQASSSSDQAMADRVERLQLKDEKLWLAVRDGIGAQIKDGDRVLEIGTGIQGVLTARLAEGVGAKKVDFVATDIDAESAAGAQKALAGYRNVTVRRGNLFEPVAKEKFNVIFWNPPWYGAEREGKRNSGAYLDEDYRNLRRFLKEAPAYLLPGGKIFVIFPRELSGILWETAPEAGLEITEHPEPRHVNPATESRVRQHVMVYELTPVDDAMKGGIDLGAGTMEMSVQDEGTEFRFDLNPADLKRYEDAPGLAPVILNIQPLESLPRFLGSHEKDHSLSWG